MKRDNINPNDTDMVHEYFVNVIDWAKLIPEAGVLNDALNKVRYLQSLGIYDTKILTTVTSLLEPVHKINYFGKELPGIEVITVPWLVRKDSVVDAKNSILVDDSKTNILNWREAGGVGLHFVKENPNFDLMEINNLLHILKFNHEVDVKVKKLTR